MAKAHLNSLDDSEIRAFLEVRGSSLVGPYVNNYTPFDCTCADCPAVIQRKRKDLLWRKPDRIRCKPCHHKADSQAKKLGSTVIAAELQAKGSQLLLPFPEDIGSPIHFTCTKCGKPAEYSSLRNLRLGNDRLWCRDCTKEAYSGENHPWYDPAITREYRSIKRMLPEYRAWVRAVFERDNYTCQITGERGKQLAAHHLYSFGYYNGQFDTPDLRLVVSNGITLSREIHKAFHNQWGRKLNTLEQFQRFHIDRLQRPFFPPPDLPNLSTPPSYQDWWLQHYVPESG